LAECLSCLELQDKVNLLSEALQRCKRLIKSPLLNLNLSYQRINMRKWQTLTLE